MRIVPALAALAILAACEAPPAETAPEIAGAWTCTAMIPDRAAAGTVRLDYRADGTSAARSEVPLAETAGLVVLTADLAGSWELDGARLTERVAEARPVSLTVAGAVRPWAEVEPAVRAPHEARLARLPGQVTVSIVESTGEGGLRLRDEASGRVTSCVPR